MSQTFSTFCSRGSFLAVAAASFTLGPLHADELGAEFVSTSFPTTASQGEPTPLDEIVVFGTREKHELPEQSTLDGELLERIARDFELYEEMEEELAWRVEARQLNESRSRVRFGYDPREQARDPVHNEQKLLPLDIVMPATMVSVDF